MKRGEICSGPGQAAWIWNCLLACIPGRASFGERGRGLFGGGPGERHSSRGCFVPRLDVLGGFDGPGDSLSSLRSMGILLPGSLVMVREGGPG